MARGDKKREASRFIGGIFTLIQEIAKADEKMGEIPSARSGPAATS